jgi:hypothetical protein
MAHVSVMAMHGAVRAFFVYAAPVIMVVLAIWLWAFLLPRQRRYYAAHPERRPYGRRLLFRMSPMIALIVVVAVLMAVQGQILLALLGVVTIVLFVISITRRWNPPEV